MYSNLQNNDITYWKLLIEKYVYIEEINLYRLSYLTESDRKLQ